ncbi:MAG: Uma2 family endonuclease, partial [Comamonadaceae bacterium CG_4_9_14_0_8_um_filter_60_18]
MNLAIKNHAISVDDYLQGELQSDIRHEYLAGEVYAMAGAGEKHNRISLNIAFHLRAA